MNDIEVPLLNEHECDKLSSKYNQFMSEYRRLDKLETISKMDYDNFHSSYNLISNLIISNRYNENTNIMDIKLSVHNSYEIIRHKYETQKGNHNFEKRHTESVVTFGNLEMKYQTIPRSSTEREISKKDKLIEDEVSLDIGSSTDHKIEKSFQEPNKEIKNPDPVKLDESRKEKRTDYENEENKENKDSLSWENDKFTIIFTCSILLTLFVVIVLYYRH